MKAMIWIVLMVAGMNAQAGTVCRDYRVKSTFDVRQFCADEVSSGHYENPRMVEANGNAWAIGPGINPDNRADRLCRILEGTRSHVSYRIDQGDMEQQTVNLQGTYAFRGKLFDSAHFDQLVCH